MSQNVIAAAMIGMGLLPVVGEASDWVGNKTNLTALRDRDDLPFLGLWLLVVSRPIAKNRMSDLGYSMNQFKKGVRPTVTTVCDQMCLAVKIESLYAI